MRCVFYVRCTQLQPAIDPQYAEKLIGKWEFLYKFHCGRGHGFNPTSVV